MDDFDRRLAIELRHYLDPIVDAPAPRWRRPSSTALRALPGGLMTESVELTVIVPETRPAPAQVGTPL